MKVKTSVTLSEDLLEEIDGLLDSSGNRSQFLETAAREYIAKLHRAQQNQRDMEIIDQRADYLNAEAMESLSYQLPL